MKEKTDAEIIELLNKIFDDARALLAAIAPEGWSRSPYVLFLHPATQQQYEEYKRISENINRLAKDKDKKLEAGQVDDYKQDDLDNLPEVEEFQYVLGLVLWDVFSNNHEVFSCGDNRVYDLGSFRGSAGFIADFLNQKFYADAGKYSYLDFYMGTIWISDRADLLPFYEFVFRLIKNQSCDWNYSFPQLHLINFGSEQVGKEDNPGDYDPGKAIMADLEKKKKDAELKKFQDELEASFRAEYEEAKYKPLIPVVQAYQNVFAKLPNGHPQKEFEGL